MKASQGAINNLAARINDAPFDELFPRVAAGASASSSSSSSAGTSSAGPSTFPAAANTLVPPPSKRVKTDDLSFREKRERAWAATIDHSDFWPRGTTAEEIDKLGWKSEGPRPPPFAAGKAWNARRMEESAQQAAQGGRMQIKKEDLEDGGDFLRLRDGDKVSANSPKLMIWHQRISNWGSVKLGQRGRLVAILKW